MNEPVENDAVSLGGHLLDPKGRAAASGLTRHKRRIAIITVNFFSADEVVEMLHSLADQATQCDLYVCVVDNSCSDDEWHKLQSLLSPLKSKLPNLLAHRNETNSGFSAGNNAGYRRLARFEPDVVIIINPDVIVQKADLDLVAEQVLSSPETVFGARTSSRGVISTGLASISKVTGKSQEILSGDVIGKMNIAYPSGHFIAMRNDIWKSLGGLSEDYFLFAEEADMVVRLGLLSPSLQVRSLDGVLVSHAGGLTSGASKSMAAKSLLTFEHATRSSVILFRKHAHLRRWLPAIIAARTLYAIRSAFVASPKAAWAVFAGLKGGLSWRVNDID